MRDAQQADEFLFKMNHRKPSGRLCIEMRKGTPEQIEQLWRRLLGLRRVLDQLDKIRTQRHTRKVRPHLLARLSQDGFAQHVDFAFRTADECDLALEEQVERACKPALWPQRTFYDRLDTPVVGGEPRHDQARIAKARLAQKNGGSGFQSPKLSPPRLAVGSR